MEEKQLEMKKKIRSMLHLDFILPEDLPNIDLYMDQVTKYMDEKLGGNKRNEEDKVLTKTMINNYTRNHLVPPPDKKKYSRAHIIQLIYIYYLKNVLSISDIQRLAEATEENFLSGEKMSEIYNAIYELERPQYFNIEASTLKAASLVEKKFPAETDGELNKMAFIYLLGYDIFSKKRLMERLIDEMVEEREAAEKEEEARKEAAKKEAAREQARKRAAGKKPAAKKAAAGKKPAAKKPETNKTAAAKKPAAPKTAAGNKTTVQKAGTVNTKKNPAE